MNIYDPALYLAGKEPLADFMKRLAATRATGVLGGGGMLDSNAVPTNTQLGEVKQTCPVGYSLVNGACVPNNKGGEYNDGQDGWMPTAARRSDREMFETSLARQVGRGPNEVDLFGMVAPSFLGLGTAAFQDWSDQQTIENELIRSAEKLGIPEKNREEFITQMVRTPEAVDALYTNEKLFSTPTVGYLGTDIGSGWGDVAQNAGSSIMGLFSDILGASPAQTTGVGNAANPLQGIELQQAAYNDAIQAAIDKELAEQAAAQAAAASASKPSGNWWQGNRNSDGSYTVGTSANRNAGGGYTVGTSANRNADGSYTIGS